MPVASSGKLTVIVATSPTLISDVLMVMSVLNLAPSSPMTIVSLNSVIFSSPEYEITTAVSLVILSKEMTAVPLITGTVIFSPLTVTVTFPVASSGNVTLISIVSLSTRVTSTLVSFPFAGLISFLDMVKTVLFQLLLYLESPLYDTIQL